MAILSADTLFHFTQKEFLIKILSEGFMPRCSKELDRANGDELTLGDHWYIPMVCFCDIPMSSIKNHMGIYGSYGIGLKKTWGIERKLNPVFYSIKESSVNLHLVISIHNQILKNRFTGGSEGDDFADLVHIYKYLKPYECGKSYRGIEKYRYYNEREWRYVPFSPEIEQVINLYNQSMCDEGMNQINQLLRAYPLTFEAKDINFIIIDSENDIDNILNVINESTILQKDDRDHILTSIITTEKIKNNF